MTGPDVGAVVPHVLQRHALDALTEQLADGGRGVVVMPCGSGKTLLGRWLAERLCARLTVVFVPTLALVPQTLAVYRSQTSWAHAAMIVCSDPTSGRAVAVDDLELPGWARSEVTASTSTRAIGDFLTGPTPGARLIVSTYHSAPRVAAALTATGRVADLVVCDEAHRLTGRPRGEFRSVLDDGVLPTRRRVFLTATPVEAAAWKLDACDEVDVAAPLSLDDEETFGPTVYSVSFADAVAAGRLVDYDVEVLAARSHDGAWDHGGALEAVLTAARSGATRILTFHSRVKHARGLADAAAGAVLPGGRVVRGEHLEAQHRAERRAAALGRLADPAPGEVSVLASARVLSEGVDVPAVDTVVFAEPRTSAVDIVQAVGRAMRLAPGKDRGRVVLAVALDDDYDEDTALAGSAWRHVWVTLRALAAMDERFAARLRTLRRRGDAGGRGPDVGSRTGGPGLHVELPDGVDLDRWLLRALDRTGASWWHHYDVLAGWARRHGHARPSQHVEHERVRIGAWVGRQRTLRRQGVLDDERVGALQALPGWAWDAREAAWWQAHTVWVRRHADTRRRPSEFERWAWLAELPGWHTSEPPARRFASLAEFAVDTCSRYRRGDLPGHLERAAGALPGWEWDLLSPDDARMVDALVEYGAWKHDLNPPHDYHHDDDLPLGAWVTAVRRRAYTGRLDLVLDLELSLIARWDWAPLRWEKAATGWRLGYLALRRYVAREGTCRVPYQHHEALPDHELNLSRWCVVQRQEHRYGRLAAERVAALEAVSGWQWEVPLREGYRPVLDDADHGTRGAYAKGCRCDPCTEANRRYEHGRGNGAGTDLVDAAKARGHLRILLGRGAAQKALARAADVNVKTVAGVADGTLARVRPETHQALMALTLDAAAAAALPGRWDSVPGGPTWELLDDMISRGWPRAWISRELGQDGQALQLRRDRVSRANAEKVAALHRRLGTRRPPPREWRSPLPTLAEILAGEHTRGERAS